MKTYVDTFGVLVAVVAVAVVVGFMAINAINSGLQPLLTLGK